MNRAARTKEHKMKNRLIKFGLAGIIPVLLILASATAPVVFTGCTTVSKVSTNSVGVLSTNTFSTLDPNAISKLAPILRTTVSGATIYAYTKDTNSVTYIGVIQVALQQFILSTDLSPAALQAAIYKLPVPALKTPEAQLIITPILSAYAAFGEQYVQAGLAQQAGWKMLVQSMVDGITDGMNGIAQIQGNAAAVVPTPAAKTSTTIQVK